MFVSLIPVYIHLFYSVNIWIYGVDAMLLCMDAVYSGGRSTQNKLLE